MPPTDPAPAPVLLDLSSDVASLVAAVCDVPSVSGDEAALADAVETALRGLGHLEVIRDGNVVVARTHLQRAERVVLAGHLDTVPISRFSSGDAANVPTRLRDGELWGRGTVDMKGGIAVMLKVAAQVMEPARDLTFLFYDCEEVEAERNGLARLGASRPELLAGHFAVLLEPTNAGIEGGCKGTLRVDVVTTGVAAHSARPWNGHNAIHDAGPVLARLAAYEAATVTVDGLDYHEALQAVTIRGGTAGNVIPDRCVVTVNYRFAPDKTVDEALAHVRHVFEGYECVLGDAAAGARPGLDLPAARDFVAGLGLPVVAKEGWTDVARFSGLGVPAVNFGPGDANLAHTDDERCAVDQYVGAERALLGWLS